MPISDPPEPLVSIEQLVFLHTVAIAEFGGSEGIRDRGLLESALARPLSGVGGVRLYTTPFARAAALMEALLRNHGFVDGNKRVAVMAAGFWLEREGYALAADQGELVEITVAVVEHRMSLEELAAWLERNGAHLSGGRGCQLQRESGVNASTTGMAHDPRCPCTSRSRVHQ